jgi:hypothetical protein
LEGGVCLTGCLGNRFDIIQQFGQVVFSWFPTPRSEIIQVGKVAFQFRHPFPYCTSIPAQFFFRPTLPSLAQFFDHFGLKYPTGVPF